MTRQVLRRVVIGAVTGLAGMAGTAGAEAVTISLRPEMRPSEAVTRAETETRAGIVLVGLGTVRPVLRPAAYSGEGRAVEASVNDADFRSWIKGFRGRALAAGISARSFDKAFRGVQYNADVVKKDRNQSEYTKQIWEYLDFAVSPSRISNGKKMLRKHRRALERIEVNFGVDKEIVTAIWGMESAYGARRGDTPLIEAIATLAYDGRRGHFFEKQLIAALKIIQAGDVDPRNMTGSWAGAMGHTQFIPTSYLAYAVDFTGDGRRDIWADDPTDALASTAAYLKRFGWKKGQPWGVEVRLPRGFNAARANRELRQSPAAWAAEGVVGIDGKPVPNYGPGSILLPAGIEGAPFMIFHNFGVIEKYNKADAYVIGVGHLADRISGGPAIQASWPRQYEPTTEKEKKEIQSRLQRLGFVITKIDGAIGPETIKAIRAYQMTRNLPPDGFASKQLLKDLRKR